MHQDRKKVQLLWFAKSMSGDHPLAIRNHQGAARMSPNHVNRVRNHSYGACTPCVLESPFKYAKPDDISQVITSSSPLLFISFPFLFFAPLPSEKWCIFVPHLYLPVISNHSKRKHPILGWPCLPLHLPHVIYVFFSCCSPNGLQLQKRSVLLAHFTSHFLLRKSVDSQLLTTPQKKNSFLVH